MIIPCDYEKLFENRLLVITGVGRSGTTILGKLLASMTPAYLVFEPALFKYVEPFRFSTLKVQCFLGVLFEDYFLPVIQGRGNWNSRDWSSIHNQLSFEEILNRWDQLGRRSEAMKWIEKENPLLIVKSLEYQNRLWELEIAVPTVRSIEIVRSGYDVVQSAVERGWYTDEWCNRSMIQKAIRDPACNVPDYISYSIDALDDEVESWPRWNAWTRAACAWRCLQSYRSGIESERRSVVKYEELIDYPFDYTEMWRYQFNLTPTGLTQKAIQSISDHQPTKRKPFDLNLIDSPERERFVEENRKLGYN